VMRVMNEIKQCMRERLVQKGDRLLCVRAVEVLAFTVCGTHTEMAVAFKKCALRSRIRAAPGA
jgi:hypothetical protein